jgi:aminoglycoside phosphotransferase
MAPSSVVGPIEGTAWRPGRSGNTVSWDGSAVVKRHASGPSAGLRELSVLARLADQPVPRVLPGTRADSLRLGYVAGLSATAAIEAGHGSRVLRAMGEAIRAVQLVNPSRFGAARETGVVIHGDFAPYNVIVSEDGTEVRAIVDWEAAHVGDPLVDLAWCEWQCQRVFPRHGYALPQLFAGFGRLPSRGALEAALATRMSELSRGAIAPLLIAPAQQFRAITFADRHEAAAFVAALSRAALAPFRAGPDDVPAEVWVAPGTGGGRHVLMNATAAAVATAEFHMPSGAAVVEDTPTDAQLAFLAGHIPAMGVSDALAIL